MPYKITEECISCGACERSCPVHAIRIAKDQREYEKINKSVINHKPVIK